MHSSLIADHCFLYGYIGKQPVALTHSLIHHFETVPNSKKLQTTFELWLSKGFQDTDCIENIVEKGEIAHFE